MRIKISAITANLIKDHCDISEDLMAQTINLPVKADIVTLYVKQIELQQAHTSIQTLMFENSHYHQATYEHALKELNYLANHNP
jgi:hypothetical protein